MSVTAVTAWRPSALTSAATSSSRVVVRAASTRSAPARAACSAMALPSPGPMPQTTTTLSCSSPTPLPTPLPLHPLGDGGLARGDPFGVLLRRDAGLLVVGQQARQAGQRDHLDPRPVLGQE